MGLGRVRLKGERKATRQRTYLPMTFICASSSQQSWHRHVISRGETMCIHMSHPGACSFKTLHSSSAFSIRHQQQDMKNITNSHVWIWFAEALKFCNLVPMLIQTAFKSQHESASRCVSISSGDGVLNLNVRVAGIPPPSPDRQTPEPEQLKPLRTETQTQTLRLPGPFPPPRDGLSSNTYTRKHTHTYVRI